MKTFELISEFCCGLVAVGLGIIGMSCDGASWLFDLIGERCWRAAKWMIE